MKQKRRDKKRKYNFEERDSLHLGIKKVGAGGGGGHSRVPLKLHPLFSASSLVERLSGQSSP
jgi:hypothetical protein